MPRAPLYVSGGERAMAAAVAIAVVAAAALRESSGWLLHPWSGGAHHLPMWAAWHGRLMVLGWALLVPLGVLAARYLKIWPGQDWPARLDCRRWWQLHLACQSGGLAAALVGLAIVWPHATLQTTAAQAHALLGWLLTALGAGQVAAGLLRGTKGGPTDVGASPPAYHGDHYDMTARRILFERAHKLGGHAALALTLVVVPLGLGIADAPRWMWLAIAGWWLALGYLAVRLQRAGWCVDTYQAIWGAARDLPGLRVAPIGWGIRRLADPEG